MEVFCDLAVRQQVLDRQDQPRVASTGNDPLTGQRMEDLVHAPIINLLRIDAELRSAIDIELPLLLERELRPQRNGTVVPVRRVENPQHRKAIFQRD